MTTALIFLAWVLALDDSNKSGALCLILFLALLSSCAGVST